LANENWKLARKNQNNMESDLPEPEELPAELSDWVVVEDLEPKNADYSGVLVPRKLELVSELLSTYACKELLCIGPFHLVEPRVWGESLVYVLRKGSKYLVCSANDTAVLIRFFNQEITLLWKKIESLSESSQTERLGESFLFSFFFFFFFFLCQSDVAGSMELEPRVFAFGSRLGAVGGRKHQFKPGARRDKTRSSRFGCSCSSVFGGDSRGFNVSKMWPTCQKSHCSNSHGIVLQHVRHTTDRRNSRFTGRKMHFSAASGLSVFPL
jgi:hypothetical protein